MKLYSMKYIGSIYETGFIVAAKFGLLQFLSWKRGIDQFWRCHQAAHADNAAREVVQEHTGENAQ